MSDHETSNGGERKNFSRRDFLRAAAVAGAGAVAAGCAPQVVTVTQVVRETSVVTEVVRETELVRETVVSPAEEKILRFWTTRFFNPNITLAFFEQSQVAGRNAGVTVDVEAITGSFTEYSAKLTAAKEAGTLADIFAPQIATRQFINNGWLLDITDVWDKVGGDLGGWHPIAERNFFVDGVGYALDIGFAPAFLHIRQDLVEEAGFTLPFADLDQMLEFARAANKPDEDFYSLAFAYGLPDDLMHLQPLMWAWGGAAFDEEGTITMTRPENVEALTWLTDVYTEGLVSPAATTWDGGGNNQAYLNGLTAVIVNPGSPLANARQKNTSVDQLLEKTYCAPWPQHTAEVGPQCQTEAGQAFGIHSECKFPDEAKQILLHIWSPDIYLSMLRNGQGYLFPSLQGALEDPYFAEDQWNKQVVDNCMTIMNDESWPSPPAPWTSLWSTWAGQACLRVVQDGWTPEEAMAEAQTIVEDARASFETA
jgi:multiple sugar transport system substrate-binding protein